jgi:hypothetical protein
MFCSQAIAFFDPSLSERSAPLLPDEDGVMNMLDLEALGATTIAPKPRESFRADEIPC